MNPELNEKALENPQVGDYWHERFSPYFVIVNVDGDVYTVLSCMSNPDTTRPGSPRANEPYAYVEVDQYSWKFDYSKSFAVTKEWIKQAVTYETIPGFVADVVRGKKNGIVEEWKEYKVEALTKKIKLDLLEAKKLLPEDQYKMVVENTKGFLE